jgi:peptidoglycan hydrolase CwlO-like protein
LYDAENRLNSLQIELGKDRGQLESQLASQRDAFERRLAKERVEMEAMASLKTQEGLKLIDEVH